MWLDHPCSCTSILLDQCCSILSNVIQFVQCCSSTGFRGQDTLQAGTFWGVLKGELKRFFLSAQSFYRPQTKTSFNRQFSPKSPKVGQKSGQRVQNWPNKNQVASDLLRASTNSVIRAAEGIHQFCHPTFWGNPLVGNFSIRSAEGIHWFCHWSYWGNPSILSSDLLRESFKQTSCAMWKIKKIVLELNAVADFFETLKWSEVKN